MFDINTTNKRYFSIRINEVILEVEPPKIKALKKIINLSKAKNEEAIDDLAEAVKLILSKNKSKYDIKQELIEELDLDQLTQILTAYFEWLNGEKNSPN
ncbi:hypothetical protein [Clostridium botulinum]|uniref:hypothetical protein n=1 Tax=Clostridium botulinum TaxID=1491 RepID=UPI0004D58730|nr:hypothetical protein [Clostridium botulinum]KEI01565.1 hypothetical protein Z952_11980 [Clostridium botulinum C/D str. BKT75002]KEI07899.1 hypothetical protein Z954_03115 [Clostridium botulinum C/D str. BKT2873]QPW61576.1 hypothetical protein IG390_05270 [Clostridium botulinum]